MDAGVAIARRHSSVVQHWSQCRSRQEMRRSRISY